MIRRPSMVILIVLGVCIEFLAATLLVAGMAVACLMAAAHAMPTETDQGSVESQGTGTVSFASEQELTAALLGEEQEGATYNDYEDVPLARSGERRDAPAGNA